MEDGVTLYGIMDETGYLRENEIFVITEKAPEGGKQILVKRSVIITRSPAMHPGECVPEHNSEQVWTREVAASETAVLSARCVSE